VRRNPYATLFTRALRQAAPDVECWLTSGVSWRREISRQRPDLLHLHWIELLYFSYATWQMAPRLARLLLVLSLARLSGIKIVYTVHNLHEHEALRPRLHHLANRFIFAAADAIHVHDESTRAELLRSYGAEQQVYVAPHGNYVQWYPNDCSRQQARTQLGLSPETFVYLCLGQVRPYKGLEELLRAFATLEGENVALLIAGHVHLSEYGDRVRDSAASDPRVRLFLDFVPDDQVQRFMNAADVCVLPYREVTTSGAAILALSFGVPVVAPAIGSFPALLADGAGLLYDPQEEVPLRSALLAAQHMDLAAARRAAQETADSLDWGAIGRQHVAVYRDILE
jgi:glycosyltransferase involved in cell wall biosynthesis